MNSDSIKRFTLGALKLACGLFAAALMLGLAVWGILILRERSEEVANAPLATLKTWHEMTVGALANAEFHLHTVWRTGNIYYQFDVKGYPPSIRQAKERGTQAAFSIAFLDKDGFKLFEHTLPIASMAALIGSDGQPAGMSWKGDESLSVDLYRRAASWDLSWSGLSAAQAVEHVVSPSGSASSSRTDYDVNGNPVEPPLPKPARIARPRWKTVSLWRGLSHGMSQDDVKRILGAPEKVANFGFQIIWYYGYPLGGELTFGRDSTLESWSEP